MFEIKSLFFSPTGTTRKTIHAFAEGFGGSYREWDITLPKSRKMIQGGFENNAPQSEEELFLFAGPVYGGRSFKLLTNTIRKLSGNGRPAVILSMYGGRHYDMALADLYEAASAAGFCVIACGAFIGEHSFTGTIQTGRPNPEDLALARDFGKDVKERLSAAKAAGEMLPAMLPEAVPQRPVDLDAIGMHREKLGHLTPNRPAPDERCLRCGACAAVCPMGLIDYNDSRNIKPGCLKCNTCVKTCPIGCMQFRQEDYKAVVRNCEETFGKEERSPQIWFA